MNKADYIGWIPLFVASHTGHLEIVKFWIAKKATSCSRIVMIRHILIWQILIKLKVSYQSSLVSLSITPCHSSFH